MVPDTVPDAADLVESRGLVGTHPANGLLYAGHADMDHTPVGEKTSTGAKAKGVCLTNGEVLPGDLTVVTEGSLYIDGDYNKYHAGNTLFDANGDVVGSPVASNVSAVIADASTCFRTLGRTQAPECFLPVASETTFNVSVYTGNQPTEGSAWGLRCPLPREVDGDPLLHQRLLRAGLAERDRRRDLVLRRRPIQAERGLPSCLLGQRARGHHVLMGEGRPAADRAPLARSRHHRAVPVGRLTGRSARSRP